MTRCFEGRLGRLALLAALAAALAVAGCGRKSALEPPPSASITAPPPVEPEPSPGKLGPLGEWPTRSTAPAPAPPPAPRPAQAKTFPLDPLLN